MHCNNRSATYKEVEEEVIRALRSVAADVKELLDGRSEPSGLNKAVTAALVKELNALETQQDRLYEFLETGVYTSEVFTKRNAALAQRREELQEAIAEAKAQEVSEVDYKQRYIALLEAVNVLENDAASAEEKNKLLRTVIKDIIYHRESDVRDKWHSVPFSLDIELL